MANVNEALPPEVEELLELQFVKEEIIDDAMPKQERAAKQVGEVNEVQLQAEQQAAIEDLLVNYESTPDGLAQTVMPDEVEMDELLAPVIDAKVQEDIIKSNLNNVCMVIKFGEYRAYCPVDGEHMINVGFYAEAKGYPSMPLGPTDKYAELVGNIYENPDYEK